MRRVTRTIKRKRVNLETLRRAKFLITHNGNKVNAPDYYALKGEVERLRVENIRLKERLAFCEECLIAMVEQYCGDYNGLNYDDIPTRFTHDYMSAGEMTFSYLVKHGLAQLDENGVDIIFPEAK